MDLQNPKKRSDCSGLPKGWQREEVIRKGGLSAGKIDIYYISPDGQKLRSKPELVRYFKEAVDLSAFDFRTGKFNGSLVKKAKKHKGLAYDYSRALRNESLVPPIRQTASIFKQPVTVHKTQKNSVVKLDLKHGPQEKPKQVFWEKRLERLTACDINGNSFDLLGLPQNINSVGPNLTDATVLQSVATALHVGAQPIMGQTGNASSLDSNPGVFLNPSQPLIQAMMVADEDLIKQEERVMAARRRLEEALRSYGI